MAGVPGFEPGQWRNQNPLPYRLATPQKDLAIIKIFICMAGVPGFEPGR